MLSIHTLLSLLLIERLAGPRAATRVLFACVWITVAPALLLGAWLGGTLAWQWGSRTWADVIQRTSWGAPSQATTTAMQTQYRQAEAARAAARAEALPRRQTAVREALLVRDRGEPSAGRNTCLWALHTVIGLDEPQPQVRGRALADGQLEWLEAACHAPALRVQAGATQERTLGEVPYGPLPTAANPSGLTPDELSRRYFPAGK